MGFKMGRWKRICSRNWLRNWLIVGGILLMGPFDFGGVPGALLGNPIGGLNRAYGSGSEGSVQGEGLMTPWPQVFWHSTKTRLALLTEKYDLALTHAMKALEREPLRPELHINLGNALEGLGSLNKALEAYTVAEKLTQDPSLRFQALFNKAQALVKLKQVDQALALYQKSLEIDPESIPVKTNIELLMSAGAGKGGKGDQSGEESEDGEGDSDPPSGKDPQKFAENPSPSEGSKEAQELSPADIKKILEEIKQQEQRIRGDYYKQGQHQKQKGGDGSREKDW